MSSLPVRFPISLQLNGTRRDANMSPVIASGLPRHTVELRPGYHSTMAMFRGAAAEWDVIVVGGGIIGCAIARELARRGARTVVLEARTGGARATQASAGVLAPFIEAPGEGPLHAPP